MDSGKIIRFCLVGLPVGLVVIPAVSIIYTEWFKPYQNSLPSVREQQFATMMRKSVSREDLEDYVNVLTEDIGERHMGKMENLKAAAYFIESSLGESNMGYKVSRQKYESEGNEVWNLEVTVPGTGNSGEIVVVGAHYDTVPGSPGADDNASGVSALMCLANAFIGSKNEMTIKFVAFVNEERPWAETENMGSLVYAKALKLRGKKVVAMISLDSLAYFSDEPDSQTHPEGTRADAPSVANFLVLVGNQASAEQISSAKSAFQKSSPLPIEAVVAPPGDLHAARSDHWAFWQMGYPGLMITDTGPFRYDGYHQANDKMSRLDFERLESAVKGIEGIIKAWANP
ncbi:MAG: M28 family peptidase [Verrucomicrobia bacterium]|nr:M28 family peptidase [Verrucomicrobiota bacterium]